MIWHRVKKKQPAPQRGLFINQNTKVITRETVSPAVQKPESLSNLKTSMLNVSLQHLDGKRLDFPLRDCLI